MAHMMARGNRECDLPDGHKGRHRPGGYQEWDRQRHRRHYASDPEYQQYMLDKSRSYSMTAAGMLSALRSNAKRRGNT